jgi:hypothetical protein
MGSIYHKIGGKLPVPLVILILTFIAITLLHTWHLQDVPQGLYIDESSVGYNAILIAHHGYDEYGVRLP